MSSSPRAPIAIVGIGCRFPGADGSAAFWRLLKEGIHVVGRVPPSRFDAGALFDAEPATPGKVSTEWGGFLDHLEDFDAEFFGISPREAERLDPQQRLLLETSWEALEDGGLVPDRLQGTQTGVFVGMWINEYEARLFRDPRAIDFYMTIGSGRYSAAGRLSYFFGLQGPSLTVDTGCSASLVAVHLACQSLWSGETSVALAAGVNAILEPNITIAYSQSRMMATDGRCKFGDARADGYVRSEGAGVVVLKPLAQAIADGDRVYATILGSAVNNDGRSSGFLTTPGAGGQQEMLRLAYRHAGVSPGTVDYVEAHGTGTRAGDPVEINALGAVLAEGREPGDVCRLGSVKTNIGHTEGAAGVAGLIKVALSLWHRQLPPSLHLQSPNPDIAWDTLPVAVQKTLEPWPAGDRLPLAGVSSFGISGTNAHVVLQGAPAIPVSEPRPSDSVAGILPISARSADALRAQLRQFRDRLAADAAPAFADLCWTASTRRTHHEHRTAVVARGGDELMTQLDAAIAGEPVAGVVSGRVTERRNRIVFVFPGQGSQWLGMGRQLFQSAPAFRRALESCDHAVRAEAGWSVIEELQASDANSRMQDIGIVQPLLFSIEVALAALWRSRGFEPSAVVGHSMGEVAAAAVAGALSIEQAAQVICRRSNLLRRVSGQGAMAVVELSLADARLALAGREQHLSVAVSNSSRSTVVAGDPAQLDALIAELEARETFCRRIKVDVASHSPQMDPLRADLLAALDGLQPTAPGVPIYSTLSGHPDDAALDADYWVRNLRAPVLFSDAIQRLIADGHDTFIEMSPHPILLPAIEEGMRESAQDGLVAVPSLRRGEDEDFAWMTAVATIWSAGYPVSWDRVIGHAASHADLPAYPWQRQRFWFDAPSQMDLVTGRPTGAAREGATRHPLVGEGVSLAGDPGARVWEFDLDDRGPRHSMAYSAGGKVIVPTSTWLDLIIAAGRELGAGSRLVLSDVSIEPLPLPSLKPAARLQVVARADGPGRFACGIYRRTEDGWIRHVASVLHLDGHAAAPEDSRRVDALGEPRDGADAYARLEQQGWAFGAPLQSIARWWTEADRTVAAVALPPVCAHEASRYWLHPAVIDSAFQTASLDRCSAITGSVPSHPISIGRVELHAGSEPVAWAVATRNNDSGDERYDASLLDDAGVTRLKLTGVQAAPLTPASRASGVVNDWLYTLEWKNTAAAGQAAAATQRGTWLIAGATDALTAAVTARFASGGFNCRDANGNLEAAIAAAAGDPGGCAGVIFLAQPTTEASGSSSAPARAALELATRLSRQVGTDRPRLWFVTRGSQPVIANERVSCEHAAVWGIGRTFAEEHPSLWGGLIDLDSAASPPAGADAVFASVIQLGTVEDQIAFRGERRYAPRLVRATIAANDGIGLRADATYVVAGGLGALGLKVAHWMVARGARRLLLLGRTALPARHAWDSPQGSRDRERILAIRKMEALGASVQVAAVDITDIDQLRGTVERVAAAGWPPVAGIIQCAGVLQGRLVGDGNDDDFEAVWRPKAQGTRNLEAVTAGQPLDFFVVFSSMASFLPSAGQASYAAANCFLDAFAADGRVAGRRVIAVNWGPWADVGMAAELSTRGALGVSSRGFDSLDAGQALAALSRVLAAPAYAQTAIMAFDWRQWNRATAAPPLFADLAATDAARGDVRSSVETAATLQAQVAAAATTLERRTIIEGLLREQVAQVLKRSPATIELIKPFRAMGLDSLMALEFRNRLEALAGVRLPATLAFNYPTIAALAPFLAAKAGIDLTEAEPAAAVSPLDEPADDVERMLAEIEQLSDADVRRLTLEEK